MSDVPSDAASATFVPVAVPPARDGAAREGPPTGDRERPSSAADPAAPGGQLAAAADAADAAEAERTRLLAALDIERARLAEVFRRSPAFIALLRGPDHVFVSVNDAYTRLVGGRNVVGRPVFEALPELRGQGFDALLDRVVATGEPFVGREVVIELAATPGGPTEEHYLDFQYLPYAEADAAGVRRTVGVIAHGVDVTDPVRARREVERLLAASEEARSAAEVARAEAEQARAASERTAAALAESEARFRTVQDASPHGLVLLRPVRERAPETGAADAGVADIGASGTGRVVDFRIRYANPAGARLAGRHADAMVGRTLLELFPATRELGLLDAYVRVVETGVVWANDVRYVADGLAAGYQIAAVRVGNGTAAELVLLYADATARLAAEAERERLLAESDQARAAAEAAQDRAEAAGREADAANRAKSGFLATMSHELRTPINAILGYTQLLELGLAGPLTDQQRGYLDRLAASSQHLLGLVNDVLDLSKIEVGETRVAHVDARTGPLVRAALDLVRPQAAAKGVRLVDARPDEAGVPFVGDEDRARQVAINLLSNAVKFTPPGGTVTVTCDTAAETPAAAGHLLGGGPWAYVRVSDTGIGIPPEEQGRIFDPFHQVEGGRTRTQGGTGLGLAISWQLARLMGGDLTVESTPGAGSTFTFWLPAARRAGGADGAQAETAAARSARAERDVALLQAPGLGEIGELLRASVDDILAAYAARLRADPAVPRGREMRRIELEDHAVSFLADLAQSLVIVENTGPEAAELLKDGSAIQRAIAEAHGARRHAQGFDEAALRRDHQILREEVERAVRGRLKPGSADVDAALGVLLGLIDRAEAISVRTWRRATDGAADAVRGAAGSSEPLDGATT